MYALFSEQGLTYKQALLTQREKARRGEGWKEERQKGREGKREGRKERRKEEGREKGKEGTINQEVRKDAVSVRAFQRNKANSITH